jgi:hypothetical protein
MNGEDLPKRQKARTSLSLSEQMHQSISQMWQRLVTASKPKSSLNPSTPKPKKTRNVKIVHGRHLKPKSHKLGRRSKPSAAIAEERQRLQQQAQPQRQQQSQYSSKDYAKFAQDCSKAATEARERGDYDEADKQADLAVKATQQAFAVSEQEADHALPAASGVPRESMGTEPCPSDAG